MQYYFGLRCRMINRQLTDFGLHPLAGYSLLFLVFLGLSFYLFSRTDFAAYLYSIIALSFVLSQSETGRNEFLKTCFKKQDYYTIRIIENASIALPFVAFLLYKLAFLPATLIMIISVLLVFFNFRSSLTTTIPTPFSRKPFEFIVGFRNTFYMIFFAYFLTVMALLVGNFNLGIFALLFVMIICLTYYANLESEFFVWIFSFSSRGFLIHKIKTALLYSTILSLPIIVGLFIFFPANAGVIVGFQIFGYFCLISVIVAKYSVFPDKINLPQVLLIAFSVSFPPLLLVVIPFFYFKSINRLKDILQ
jgi:hypothetical protein